MRNLYCNFSLLVIICLTLFTNSTAYSQVSGNVFLDVNNNGVKSNAGSGHHENGMFGVVVKAYNAAGNRIDSTTCDGNGNYSLPLANTFPVRLEFINPTNVFPAKRGAINSGNVQFLSAPSTTADYCVGYHSQQSTITNPFVVTTASSNGNATASGVNEAGLRQNLFITPYNLDNTWKTGANYQNRWLGSIFGITFQKETRTLLLAAYLKRHAGFGPGGIDAIYKTVVQQNGDAAQPQILLNLSNVGINVGTDPRTVALPNNPALPNSDLGVFGLIGKRGIGNIDLAENGKDMYITNLFENKIHRIDIGMPVKNTFSALDVTGTWSIPGPGLSGTEWHIMAVKYYRGLIYIGGVTSKQRIDAPQLNMGDVNSDQLNLRGYVYTLDPSTGIITEVLQFPFNYRRSHLIDQYRYEFKTNWWRAWQNNGDADILRNDFNDALEAFPQPAAPFNTSQNTGIIYPQPMLADIEFDTDGAMVLGIRDRFGDQSGLNNYLEGANGNQPTSGNQYFRGFAAGEVLRAGKNGTTFTLENNASVTNNGVSGSSNLADAQGTPPAGTYAQSGSFASLSGSPYGWSSSINQGYGPGGRYFYYNHAFTSTGVPLSNIQDGNFDGSVVHYTKAFGGIGILPGSDEIVLTTLSPEGRPFTSGLLRFSNGGLTAGTNSGNMTDQQELVPGTSFGSPGTGSDPSSFGKSNGIGDVEVLSDAMPIEIGNRIWLDTNNNGYQDANESGIPNVTVLLRSPGIDGIYATADDQVWTTVSSNVAGTEGYYYFDNTLINDNRRTALGYIGLPANSGVLNNQLYRIEIDPFQPALSGYTATITNAGGMSKEHIDNDGALANLPSIGDRLYVNVNTANNNYNFDFGVRGSVLANTKLDLIASLNNETVKLKWQTLDEVNTSKFYIERSVKNTNQFLPIAEQVAGINTQGTKEYNAVDNISSVSADVLFYRIKLLNQDASFKYSNIVTVKKSATQNLQVWPTPFNKIINISFNSTVDYTASIVLFDQLGKQIETINKTIIKGVNFISITPKATLPKGIYFIKILNENGMLVNTRKLVKQ